MNNKGKIRNKEIFIKLANEPYGVDVEDLDALHQVGYEFVIADGKLIDVLRGE